MTKRRFGKLLELEGFGHVIEVLPYVFASAPRADGFIPGASLFFDRFVRVRFDYLDERVEVSDELFESAIWTLGDRVGSFDLSPGISWAKDPVGFAALVAAGVHLNQQDKLGFPYIEHPRRVFLNSEWSLKPEDLSESERVVGYQAAWLHDVIEDSKEFFYRPLSVDDLSSWGFSDRVISVVSKLTRPENESAPDNYYRQILLDTTARAVKLADIADNLARWRVALLPKDTQSKLQKKYEKGLAALLFEDEDEGGWFELRIDTFDEGPWPVFALPESHQALKRAKRQDRFVLNLSRQLGADQAPEQMLSEIQREAEFIILKQLWVNIHQGPSSPNWRWDIALEEWYTAYLYLLVKREARHGEISGLDQLGAAIDGIPRSEASFQFRHLGLVPRNISTMDVRLRLPRALLLMRALINCLEPHYPNYHGGTDSSLDVEQILRDAPDETLLDASALAFSRDHIPWADLVLKHLVVELDNRMRS